MNLEPCALNAEFRHFILRFNKNVFYFVDTTESEDRGERRRPKERVTTGLLYG
jgi:hypothetical protein